MTTTHTLSDLGDRIIAANDAYLSGEMSDADHRAEMRAIDAELTAAGLTWDDFE